MTKEEYKKFIDAEVYHGNGKLSTSEKRFLKYTNPATNAVYLLRTAQYRRSQKGRINRWLAQRASVMLVRRYNIYVSAGTEIGIGLAFPHPTGIIIGMSVKIGENCAIFQHVTLGSRHSGEAALGLQPHLGNNVKLFAGCAVVGAVTLGNGVTVGANSVMNKDAPDGTVWAGVPARRIAPR